MQPERYPPNDPREWLRLARADLALADSGLRDVPPEPLCFHTQQAAERALKAVMLARAVPFPHIHDLGELIRLLSDAGAELPENLSELPRLTRFAVLTCYPFVGEVTEAELAEAIQLAVITVDWAAGVIAEVREIRDGT